MLECLFIREFRFVDPALDKICGITQNKDADYAAQLGVNALGFVFYSKSPRSISSKVLKIIDLKGSVSIVALFVDPTKDEVSTSDSGLIDLIQFHGNESEEFVAHLIRHT